MNVENTKFILTDLRVKGLIMKQKIFLVSLILVLSSFLLFAGPRRDQSQNTPVPAARPEFVKAAALNGPSGIGMVYLFEGEQTLNGVPLQTEITATPDVLLPKLLKGEVDIGILPPNAAAKVYTKNNGAIIMGAIVGNGMLQLITEDTSVNAITDLKGKTVYVAAQGSTPDYMIRYLADKAGVEVNTSSPNALTLDFSIPAAELAAALISGKIAYAFVPEPFATVAQINKPSVRRAFDVQKLYAFYSGNTQAYPMTVVVVRKAFAEAYPEFVSLFLEQYKKSIDKVNADPANAGVLVEKYSLGLKAPIVAKAVPSASFVYTDGKESREQVEALLSIFLKFAPDSIGGALPDAGFYFK